MGNKERKKKTFPIDLKRKKEETSFFHDESVIADEPPVKKTPVSQLPHSLEKYTIGNDIIRQIHEGKKEQDYIFGPKYDPVKQRYFLGGDEIDFNPDGSISVAQETYAPSPGLWSLIFHKEPENYSPEDVQNYRNILLNTSVHLQENNPGNRVRSANANKYKYLIKNLMVPAHKGVIAQPKLGEGLDLMDVKRNSKIEYTYWNEVNELVERLRLLIASSEAGNTSHRNEIHEILSELKEGGYILFNR